MSSTNHPGCLTWEVHAGYLNLTCRLENFVQPVTLIDNHEKAHISCTLKKAKHNIGCIPKKRRKHISFDSSLQTVTFTIKNKYSNYVDGNVSKDVIAMKRRCQLLKVYYFLVILNFFRYQNKYNKNDLNTINTL